MSQELPLSAAQEGIWIGQSLDSRSAGYVVAEAVRLEGSVDLTALQRAATWAIEEAHGLRARVEVREHRAYQRLDAALRVQATSLNVGSDEEAHAFMNADRNRVFDLSRGPLVRHVLLRVVDKHVYWYIAAHHIALDGYAFSMLIERAAALYSAIVDAREPSPSPFSQLADAVAQDLAYRESADFTSDRSYWQAALADMPDPPVLCHVLPDYPAAPRKLERELSAETLSGLDRWHAQRGPGWVHTLTALMAAYVQARTGVAEVVFGMPVMARTTRAALRCPTMMMNIAPLRLRIDGSASLEAAGDDVRRKLGELLPRSRYRYEQLRRDLGRLGGDRRLFGPVLNIMPFARAPAFAGLSASVISLSSGPVEDLSVGVHALPNRGGVRLCFDAHQDAYSDVQLEQLADEITALITSRATAWTGSILPPGRDTVVIAGEPLRRPATDVVERILEHARATPQRVAIQGHEVTLSYRDVLLRAQGLAARLTQSGVARGSIVALHLRRSPEAVVAMLAVLLCRAAYLPLDPDGPIERSSAVVRDASPALLLHDSAAPMAAFSSTKQLSLQETCAAERLPEIMQEASSDPAYVIYTSGSTGKPNGVVVSRAALAHFVAAAGQRYDVHPEDRVLQFAPLAFDASIEEIFLTLCSGGRLVLRSHEMLGSLSTFLTSCASLQISLLDLPTAFFHELVHALVQGGLAFPSSVQTVIIGGEAALAERVQQFHAATGGLVRLLNTYGPTEATVVATSSDLSLLEKLEQAELPIGLPLPGVVALLEPLRSSGSDYELYLTGPSLADGYLNQPALTEQRFVEKGRHGRAYRTGDVVTVRADGQLVFRGRRDDQLKISGHRVELSEVESVLSGHPDVSDVAVVPRELHGQTVLVAHTVFASQGASILQLRQYARAHLLAAAVPRFFELHDALPKTTNGKVDRRELAAVALTAASQPSAAVTATERIASEVFREVLGITSVDLDQDFFELGGESLQVLQAASRLGTRIGRDVTGATIFRNPTVRSLALALDLGRPVEQDDRQSVLSHAQLSIRRNLPSSTGDAHQIGTTLLTGATGFLGVQLLRALLRTDRPVVCLLRGSSEAEALHRLRCASEAQGVRDLPIERLRVVLGDLAKPELGMRSENYRALARECDVILHNGASVSLARGFQSLRAVILESTRSLIELASTEREKRLHYVSTLAAALGSNDQGVIEERFVEYHPGLQDGYSQSKWASEHLLKQVFERGGAVKVYRLGRLVGALDGAYVNRDDLVFRLLAAGLRLGALPLLGVHEPWTPVDVVARIIVAGLDSTDRDEPVLNLSPAQLTSLDQVMRWTCAVGYRLKLCDPPEFGARLKANQHAIDASTFSMLEALSDRTISSIRSVQSERADALMSRHKIVWPRIEQSQVRRYLETCFGAGDELRSSDALP